MNRKSRSMGRRSSVSSILKIDWNKEEETGLIGNKSKRASRRVSFAETYQVKEFPRDSPRVWKEAPDSENDENKPSTKPQGSTATTITGLDKLLTGAIQTPYQDLVMECSLAEVSVDSFNIFDPNPTMLDVEDMDCTNVTGSIELPTEMAFQSEPSGEIKIDQGAFLKSLTDSSDSLKPLQIYSPFRDKPSSLSSRMSSSINSSERSPLKGLPVQSVSSFNYQDKENIMFHTEMVSSCPSVEELDHSQPLYDVKKFFSNLLGTDASGSSRPESARERTAGQDVTKIFSGEPEFGAIEETKCVGGILAQGDGNAGSNFDADETMNLTIPMEETKPLGGLINKTLSEHGTVNDLSNNDTVVMEETKVTGGILDKTAMCNVNFANADETVNIPVAMEETKPLGGLIDQSYSLNMTGDIQSDDKTVAMEETKPIGGILDRTSVTLSSANCSLSDEGMDITMTDVKPTIDFMEKSPQSDTTADLLSMSTVAMEETQAIGGILDKTCASEKTMEGMKPVGGLIGNAVTKELKSQSIHKTFSMEETRTVGGILDDTTIEEKVREKTKPAENLSINIVESKPTDQSFHKTFAMEETRMVGGILDKTSQLGLDVENCSLYQTMAMEETKPVGGITNKSLLPATEVTRLDDQTMTMEETKAVGGILSTNSFVDSANTKAGHNDEKETLTNNKSLEKSAIEERTVTFDKFQADWTESQLLLNRSSLTTANDLTKLSSEIVSEKGNSELDTVAYVDASVRAGNRTIAETQVMEETKCVTGFIEIGGNSNTKPNDCKDEEYVIDEDITFKKKSVDSDNMDMTNCVDQNLENLAACPAEEKIDISKEEVAETESLPKLSSKRSFRETRDSPDADKTRDLTQSQMQLTKLKEMLINSKKKTAAHLRSGDMRTPSKFLQSAPTSAVASRASSIEMPPISTGSPVQKRARVHLEMSSVDAPTSPKTTSVANPPTGDGKGVSGAHNITSGIDDEEMPDDMRSEFGTFLSGNETRSEHSHSTGPASSENKSYHSSNTSVVSNKSFASSFNIPEGPLSLEAFYTLTTRPLPTRSRGRCSTMFASKIDLDDMEEVLNAMLTLAPLVEAKKNMEKSQRQKIDANAELCQWLEKTLEETQPQIFQEVAVATADEIQEIQEKVKTLVKCSYSEAETAWKEETGKMVATALSTVQTDCCQRAEGMLEDIRTESSSVDQLLMSLDTELESLEATEKHLTELQDREDALKRNDTASFGELEEKKNIVNRLESDLNSTEQAADIANQRDDLKQRIAAQLMCVYWNLDEMTDDSAVFTFNSDCLELRVDWLPASKEKSIKSISFTTRQSKEKLRTHEEMALHMAVEAVDTKSLAGRFPTLACLPQVLSEVSQIVTEVNQFCDEVRATRFKHKLYICKNTIGVKLWSSETLDIIKVDFCFDVHSPLSRSVSATVQVMLGSLMPEVIESRLKSVKPGPNYLSRLTEAVNLPELHK